MRMIRLLYVEAGGGKERGPEEKGKKKKGKKRKALADLTLQKVEKIFLLDVVSAECTISPLPSLFRRLSAAQNTHISCFFSLRAHTHTRTRAHRLLHVSIEML